jgi:aldose 1-epimerase
MANPTLTRAPFGVMPDGTSVDVFTLGHPRGVEVRAITYGAIIASLRVPDRAGRIDDVVLGHDTLEGYLNRSRYFGAVVGRYANRIARGRFTIDGATYQLVTNQASNHLHGGLRGFDKVVWHAEPFERDGEAGVALAYTSPDGDQGYPGTLHARVTYTLTGHDEPGSLAKLTVDYEATTDRATPINLTQHTYFNLGGEGNGDILGHALTIFAESFTPVDDTQIPTGEIAPVGGTPFDFRASTAIGARIEAANAQLRMSEGYDHNFVLNGQGSSVAPAARVVDPRSGRALDVSTTEPGMQFYSGNRLDGSLTGKSGHAYGRRSALCLETQHFPDSPNHPSFPTTILRPGGRFRSTTVFGFGVI